MRKKAWTVPFLLAAAVALGGCEMGGKEQPAMKAMGENETATIKVAGMMDERSFQRQYGQSFALVRPQITLDYFSLQGIVSAGGASSAGAVVKTVSKWVEEERPDVLMLPSTLYPALAEQDKLLDLEPVIGQDRFDLKAFLPQVLDAIRAEGGGKLYGLAPEFSGQALFYNKQLFDQAGLSYPTDGMNWDQTLELARRFPTAGDDATRPYGLSLGNSDSILRLTLMIGTAKGLYLVRPDAPELMLDSEGWHRTAQQVVDAYRSKAILGLTQPQPTRTMRDRYLQDPFIAGRVAMLLSGSYTLDTLRQASNELQGQVPQWDLASVPSEDGKAGQGSTIMLPLVFSVSSSSSHPRAAWEFVKFINGDDFARAVSKAPASGNLPSRSAYVQGSDGRNMAAFYKGGSIAPEDNPLKHIPEVFIGQLFGIAEQELKAAVSDGRPAAEAMRTIQEKGQLELLRVIQQQEAQNVQNAPPAAGTR